MACRGLHRHAVEQPSRRWRAGHDSRSAAKYQDVRHDGVVLVHARYHRTAVDPVDTVSNTVPFGVLGGGFKRLVLDVDADVARARWERRHVARDIYRALAAFP